MPTPRSPVNGSDRLTVIAEGEHEGLEKNVWNLCKMPFWQHGGGGGASTASGSRSSSPLSSQRSSLKQSSGGGGSSSSSNSSSSSVTSVAKSFLSKRRLKLDPATKLYFPYEPGKQVRSAIRIKNISKFHVAFKFQTTSPKSCFMRPAGAVLAPCETIVATVFKFVELPEEDEEKKEKLKFKILSLKVNGPSEYLPEWFEKEKEHVRLEQILQVVFLDKDCASSQMEKLKRLLAEAEAAFESRKKLDAECSISNTSEGLVIDEWRRRREEYLAQQQVAGL